MNPFLALSIMLILRWLQFIGSQQLLGDFPTRARILAELIESTERHSANLSKYALNAHQMTDDSNDGKQVM